MNELKVTQLLPVKKRVLLEGLYLDQRLLKMSKTIGKSVVFADFLTDKNGIVAKADKPAHFQVPLELKNSSDWGLFQELMAQADVIISAGTYFKRLATPGATVQDILYQLEPGNEFEKLGQWRLNTGYKKRSPDLAVVSQHLDFEIPEGLLRNGRKITVFTTKAMATSEKARALNNAGALIRGSGEAGVDGQSMIATLANGMGYRVMMMASGPSVLELLLSAKCLDLLYVTQAQKEIPFDDPIMVKTMLSAGKQIGELKDFGLAHQFVQDNVVTEDGSLISQLYLRYDRKDIREQG
jgi:riboflavin biosynthesis pyrimidine reductase